MRFCEAVWFRFRTCVTKQSRRFAFSPASELGLNITPELAPKRKLAMICRTVHSREGKLQDKPSRAPNTNILFDEPIGKFSTCKLIYCTNTIFT